MKIQVIVNKQDRSADVFIDGEFWRKIPKGLIKRGLHLEKSSEKEVELYFNALEKKGCESYLIWLLSRKSYLKKQVFQKLKKRGFQPEIIEPVLEKFTQMGFLDDSAFLKSLIFREKQKGYGRRMVSYKLKLLGIDQDRIAQALENFYSKEEEKQVLEKMQNKKRGKPLAFWIRRGFDLALF